MPKVQANYSNNRDKTRAKVELGGDDAIGPSVVSQDDKSTVGREGQQGSGWKVLEPFALGGFSRQEFQTRTRGPLTGQC